MTRRALPPGAAPDEEGEPVKNPADHGDVVGVARHARPDEISAAIASAPLRPRRLGPPCRRTSARRSCAAPPTGSRQNDELVGLVVREAGKSYANAVGEVREAADFLRYYAAEAIRILGPGSPAPLGVVASISPWNFPLAIFTGQVAAALAAGNAVIAKPAEETPLIAAEAVRVLHEAGVPREALALLPGAGEVGAAVVDDPRVQGVMFTGSTPVARLIEKELASRLTPRRRAGSAHRRDRRPERDGGRFVGPARAGRRRRDLVGLRFGRSALLGLAHPLPAGRRGRPDARDAEGGDGRARGRRCAKTLSRRRPGHHRRGAGRHLGPHRDDVGARLRGDAGPAAGIRRRAALSSRRR